MEFSLESRPVLKYICFILLGVGGTLLLMLASEVTKFSYFNVGGISWASWSYPIYFLISFLFFYKIFHLPQKVKNIIVILFVILFVWFYYITQGSIFQNPIPFGLFAYPY